MNYSNRIVLGIGIVATIGLGAAMAVNTTTALNTATAAAPAITAAAHQAGAAPDAAKQVSHLFEVDAGHSSMIFKIRHLGVANFMGRFNSFGGSYTLDPANLESSTFNFTVDANSVDTNSSRRDGHIKSPDFFDVANHPEMTFESTKVEKKSDTHLLVRGDLTFRGVTKPVDVTIKIIGAAETQQGYKNGIDASFTFKRSDFGNDTYVANGGLSDEVEIMVTVEGVRKDAAPAS